MPTNLENSAVATGLVGQFSFQSQRKPMPKNVQTITQLNSSHMLAKQCSKFSKPASTVHESRTSRCTSWIRKGRGTRDQIAKIHCIVEKAREFQKNIYCCFIDYAKAFDYANCGKFSKRWEYQTTLPAS